MPSSSFPIAPDAPLFIVMNAASGRTDPATARSVIENVVGPMNRRLHWHMAERPRQVVATAWHAAAQATRRNGVLVAAGGDGTINAVVQAAHGSGCPMGVLPLGTFNYFSRTHGIAQDLAEATRTLLTAPAQPVQVAAVNERIFLVNASLGLYPEVLEDRESWEARYGRSRLVALASGLATLMREHRQLRLLIEHAGGTREVKTPTLFIGNNRLQFEQVGIPHVDALDRGCIAAVMLRPVSSLAMLGLLLRGAFGTLGDAQSIESFEFNRMTVRPWAPYGRRQVKVAVDGEVTWMRAPLEFRVAAKPLYLVKPMPVNDGNVRGHSEVLSS